MIALFNATARIVLNSLLAIILIGSICWFLKEGGYEPALAMLSATNALFTVVVDGWTRQVVRKNFLRFRKVKIIYRQGANGFFFRFDIQSGKKNVARPSRRKVYPRTLVIKCQQQVAAGRRQADVAREYGISPSLVSQWCKRRCVE